ncbi:MAG TPA: efflux RND transporter periplasmic adaptor subunit [Gemmatimonadales bacterium]|nr:efflux RND transporter periplasmic adaptor subunit [Gemmatimonadales bacterium]
MPKTTWTLVALVLVGCGKKQEAAVVADSAAWVGRENITIADQRELSVGPEISGALMAERQATVRAELTSTVTQVNAEAGQRVSAGAILGRLDDAGIRDAYNSSQAAVQSADANARIAARDLERATRLESAGAVATSDVEKAELQRTVAEAQAANARAQFASAEKNLARTVIRAPFTGIVSERPVNLGDVVQSGNPLFTIVDPNSFKFEGTVPLEALKALKVGTPVYFTAAGLGELKGKITRINPAVDPATRQVRVTVGVPNSEGNLVAGLFAEGRVATSTRQGVVVPSAAVDRRGIRPYVMRVKGGKVEKVEVELGLIDAALEQMEIARGLEAGDTLLLGGARGLAAGTPVRIGSPAETIPKPAATPPAGAKKE